MTPTAALNKLKSIANAVLSNDAVGPEFDGRREVAGKMLDVIRGVDV